LDSVVEEVVGEQLIAQVVEQRLRCEYSRIGDFEDEVPPGQQGHAMLLPALQSIGLKLSSHFIRGEPTAFPGDQVAQDTDFIVN
jgi:hypothetical protein